MKERVINIETIILEEAMEKVLAIIPAFNEEQNIEMVVEGLNRQNLQLDYVVVNDGSTDRTADICREKGYNLLDLPVNLGLAGCFQAGMKYAYKKGYEYVVQFDGDGQHKPEFIQAMRSKMEEGYDLVIGSRFLQSRKNFSSEPEKFFCKNDRKQDHHSGNPFDYRCQFNRSHFWNEDVQQGDD